MPIQSPRPKPRLRDLILAAAAVIIGILASMCVYYSGITIAQTDTQVSISSVAFGTVTFNL